MAESLMVASYCRAATTWPFETHFPLTATDPVGHECTVGVFGAMVPAGLAGVVGSVMVCLLGTVGNAVFPVVLVVPGIAVGLLGCDVGPVRVAAGFVGVAALAFPVTVNMASAPAPEESVTLIGKGPG